MDMPASPLPVLEYLQRQLTHRLLPGDTTYFRYPTAISNLLGFRLIAVGEAMATLAFDADPELHGNQQGTVHGGMLCELADAAIGTAHSTLIQQQGESFTSIDLRTRFLRPVWKTCLIARARAVHIGRTISHYRCDIERDDGKLIALVESTVMTLRGAAAQGR